jgi:hypothetical protein
VERTQQGRALQPSPSIIHRQGSQGSDGASAETIADTFVRFLTGGGLGTGLALRSDSSLMRRAAAPGERRRECGGGTARRQPVCAAQGWFVHWQQADRALFASLAVVVWKQARDKIRGCRWGSLSASMRADRCLHPMPHAGMFSPKTDGKAVWHMLTSSFLNLMLICLPIGLWAGLTSAAPGLIFSMVSSGDSSAALLRRYSLRAIVTCTKPAWLRLSVTS